MTEIRTPPKRYTLFSHPESDPKSLFNSWGYSTIGDSDWFGKGLACSVVFMGRQLRYLPKPTTTFEVTCKAIHGRMLLTPSGELNQRVLGVIGRALTLYPVLLHLFVTASNHIHLLITVSDFKLLSDFMCYLNSNLAREAGKLHQWKEKFWGRRFVAIPIDGELDLIRRVRYILSHGCKENLVRHPAHWPGVQCVQALTGDQTLSGIWYDRTAHYNASRRGESAPWPNSPPATRCRLAPCPYWST